MSNKSPKRPTTRKPKVPQSQRTTRDWLKQALLAGATLIGGIVAVWTMGPRISLLPQSPLISSNALTAPFQVSNDSWYSIYDVNAACSPKDLVFVDPDNPNKRPLRILGPNISDKKDNAEGFLEPKLKLKELEATHKQTFPCALRSVGAMAEWIRTAHILIVVKYHLPYLPFTTFHYRQRFELIRDSSGQFRWMEEPPSDHNPN